MRKIIKMYQPYMLRPIINKIITKCLIGLLTALLWDRYVNKDEFFTLVGYPILVVGIVLVGLAWFSFLSLDGLRFRLFPNKNDKKQKKQAKRFAMKDMIDFTEEPLDIYGELEPDEQSFCNMVSSLLSGLGFILVSALSSMF